jgi:predicted phosphodiesterase
MIHDLKEIDLSPAAAGFQVVVSGHSHKPLVEERKGVLYVNPGSAGPRRFSLPISVARLKVRGETVSAELIELLEQGVKRNKG